MSKLLTSSGDAFACVGCNTLRMDIPFSPRDLAEAMDRKGMSHLPDCVLASDAYPRNTGHEGSEEDWQEVATTWNKVSELFSKLKFWK